MCGDGRNDLFGYFVRYCVYILMEYVIKVVVDMVVVDKREIGGNFVIMEKEGFWWFLEKMVIDFFFSEIIIDVLLLIMKLVCEMKGIYIIVVFNKYNGVVWSICR